MQRVRRGAVRLRAVVRERLGVGRLAKAQDGGGSSGKPRRTVGGAADAGRSGGDDAGPGGGRGGRRGTLNRLRRGDATRRTGDGHERTRVWSRLISATGGDQRSQHGAGGKERGEPGNGGGHRTACTAVGEIGGDGGKGREAGRGAHGARDGRTVHGTSGWESETLGRSGVSGIAGGQNVGCSVEVNAKTFLDFEAEVQTPLDIRAQQPTTSKRHRHRPRPPHTYGPAPAQLPP